MSRKRFESELKVKLKKIQKSGGLFFIVLPKKVIDVMGWKAQDDKCLIVPMPEKARNRVILQRVTFDEP